jgi:hypothetical protein
VRETGTATIQPKEETSTTKAQKYIHALITPLPVDTAFLVALKNKHYNFILALPERWCGWGVFTYIILLVTGNYKQERNHAKIKC